MMQKTIAACSIVTVMGGLVLVPPAEASTLGGNDQHVVLTERPGERNDVSVNWGNNSGASLNIRDYAGLHDFSGPCARFAGGTYDALCSTPGRPQVTLRLGSGDDLAQSGNLNAVGSTTTMYGGPGRDKLSSDAGSDRLFGGPGNDVLVPDEDYPGPRDYVSGGAGTDLLDLRPVVASTLRASLDNKANDGRPGDRDNYRADIENMHGSHLARNTLVGSNRKNILSGGDQADRLVGGGGKDHLNGGSGNDTINALDGRGGDRVNCSAGADLAYLDVGDVITRDCEKRVFAAKVAKVRYVKERNRVVARVSCPKTATVQCKGTIRLVRGGKQLLSRGYTIKRGKTKSVALKPNARGRKALRSKKQLKVKLFASPRGTRAPAGRNLKVRRR